MRRRHARDRRQNGGYANATSFAPICTPAFGGAALMGSAVGLWPGDGAQYNLSCPAGKVVTGISGLVDGNESPVKVTLRCN